MKIKTFLGYKGACITIRGLPENIANRIVANNHIPNPEYANAEKFSSYSVVADSIPEYLDFAWLFKDEVTCYRGALDRLPTRMRYIRSMIRWTDQRTTLPVKFPKLKLSYTAEQDNCMTALEDVLRYNRRPFGNMLFVASTAVGKTILQAVVAARLGQKALVICPTDLIMRTWVEDLKKAYGINKKSIGIIKQKKWIIGEHFTLASLQTLGRRQERWGKLNNLFGTIIVDEVQGCSAPTLFTFLTQCPAMYLVGATATMDTRSGPNFHLKALFGSPIIVVNTYHRETATSLPISEVRLIETDFRYVYQQGNLDWHDLSMHLTGDEDRNQLIIKNVSKEWSSGRSILIVTKTREHCSLLVEMLLEAGVTNVNEINGSTNTNRFYTDKLLRAVRSRKVTCIVATLQAIKTGANIPTLDSLHIVMPPANRRDWEQVIGRIRRKADGKESAVVSFYFDKQVGYILSLYKRIIVPVMRKMKVPGFENLYLA